ncbi:Receptor-like serine/threonine-protein kinase [Striga hermonthica]|uniref:non-specific serine/threonine protein kinase n=1 Tax=Striga hermonthica TaxID=68872 RepID=A0A9N7RII9_STRHE|nr:Receptor-like serine/threonine-protein kinase [Striga hermonthica]
MKSSFLFQSQSALTLFPSVFFSPLPLSNSTTFTVKIAAMPSRRLLSPPAAPVSPTDHLLPPLAGGLTAAFSCLILLVLCFRRITRKRTAPATSDTDSRKPPHRLSYSLLRRATSNFSPSLRLGQGGFGSVYRGEFNPGPRGSGEFPLAASRVAVKLMNAGSLQGEREFQNELLFASKIDCKYIVSVLGFSSNPSKRRMLLIYELMENGSLQNCLFHKKSEELRNWGKRFSIALNIARGLEYLHHSTDPPIIHGDIKPSNILLDGAFNAKIGDFGLARFKVEEDNAIIEAELKNENPLANWAREDNGSGMEDAESVIATSGFEEVNSSIHSNFDTSPESVIVGVETSPEAVVDTELQSPEVDLIVSTRTVAEMSSPCEGLDKTSISEGTFDKLSIDRRRKNKKKKSISGKDWWWKQDSGSDGDSMKVKDYVMEWIGNEIKNDMPKSDSNFGPSVSKSSEKKVNKKSKKKKRQLDWWVSLDDEKDSKKKNKGRPAREWWKEEYCSELEKNNKKTKKKKKKKKEQVSTSEIDSCSENWWSRGSKGSGDVWRVRNNSSYDSVSVSGGISSTPSMRGTVCYIAPEYGNGADVSEKCDVYSYGVLLLVLIAGRRPLQVTGSPMSEFQRANLLSWARHLARSGKLLELVDERISRESMDNRQALLCLTVALLCLQKFPARRPSMREVVGMLLGDLTCPQLPVEFSPSPHGRFLVVKSHKKVR